MTKMYLRAAQVRFSRRRALQAIGALVGTTALGCGDDSGASSDAGSTGSTGTGATTDVDPTTGAAPTTGLNGTTTTSGASDSDSGSTTSGGPDDPSSTGTTEAPTTGEPVDECAGSDLSPEALLAGVEHVVVLMMENRSFDHYFGALKLVEGRPVEGLSGDESSPSLGLGDVTVFKMDEFQPKDPPHSWDECHTQFNLGENNGFVFENEKKHPGFAEQVMG